MTWLLILVIIFLTIAAAFFSGAEVALFSLSSPRLKAFAEAHDATKRLIARLLQHPKQLLVTVFMLNTVCNILIQNVTSSLFGAGAGWGLKVGVPFILILFFGEVLPKYVCLQNNLFVAMKVAAPISWLHNILGPVRRFAVVVTEPISRALFFFLKTGEKITKEEMQHTLTTSTEHGVLSANEAMLIKGFLNLQDTTVKEIMRPKEDVVFYDIKTPLTSLTHDFSDLHCSRIPVCDGTFQNMIGIISAQAFFVNMPQIADGEALRRHLEKPFFTPEGASAKLLLQNMYDKNIVMALVVDEYGLVCGLVTLEDIAEQVIGKVADWRDKPELVQRSGDNEIITSGRLEIAEFNEIFHSDIESKNNVITLGGWLIEQLDEIPKAGSKLRLGDFLFHILSATPTRVLKIFVRKIKNRS